MLQQLFLADQTVTVPSSLPTYISPLVLDQLIYLTFGFPFKLAVYLAYLSLPGFSKSKIAISPSSKPPVMI